MDSLEIIGRLTADAKNVTKGNSSFISMNVVSNKMVNKVKTSKFFSVTANTNRYANMLQYLKKGTAIRIIGEVNSHAWLDKDNNPQSDLRVNVNLMEFWNLDGPKPTENGEANANTDTTTAPATNDASQDMTMPPLKSKTKTKAEPAPAVAEANATNASDDLPF